MWKYIYGTYKSLHLGKNMNLGEISLNGGYDVLFFNEGQFKAYEIANITKLSQPIPLERYTGKIPVIDENEQLTGEFVLKPSRFIMLKYSDLYTTPEDLVSSISKCGSINGVDIFNTVEDARQWIRNNTDLVEIETGKFELYPAGIGINGEPTEPQYLIID